MSEAMLPSDPSSAKGQRYALVVGVNSAPHITHLSLLESAEENALSVANVLQKHCDCTLVCESLLGTNATANAVRQALNTLAMRRTDDDILLFYFAGHGFIHEDPSGQRQVYLATSDIDGQLIQEGEDIDSISLDWLRERLYEKTKAGRVLLLLDCCYAGNMGRIPGDLPLDTIFDLFKHYLGATNDVSLRKYRVTIAATGHDAEASEKDEKSMTKHLLAVLRGERHEVLNQDGEVTIGRLYDYLHQIMPAEQKPSFSGDTAGRGLVLAIYPKYSAQVLQAQQWITQQDERRERLQILSAAPDGERFLRDRLESFVGRETELRDIQQRIAAIQPSGGYVTITGQAGQGKSSIIAALIARNTATPEERECIPFHFIPFNPGPEYQVSLLRNLMARLILKYELSDLYVVSESRPTLRDFFPKVLSDVAAKRGQEIIFIDGLDQIESASNGVRDLSFLPTNPPAGIVFVLGTRPDDTLKPLELLKPTQSYLLPPLSRNDFSLLLQHRRVPPLEPRIADQFYEKMQQNALYLDLLARELYTRGPITPHAIEIIIHQLAENPDNIFSLALERLERREDWHEVIKPLLGILLVEYEPLTPWQLRTILNLDHRQVQNGLQSLSGLVTHIEQRYTLYHLKFQDFLRQDETRPDKSCIFATDEEAKYHARLIQWCERDHLSVIWEDTRDVHEQSWRVYVRHHYISHLYAARQWDRLFMVLDERSYGQAKERYDVGVRSYIQDLKKGYLAATWTGWNNEQQLKYLPHLWRYTLLRCSIQSAADQYPLELFEVMLVLGKEREVAGLIELITEPDKKGEVLLLLAQHLFLLPERKQEGAAIYIRAEEVAHSIQNGSEQAWALAKLAAALAQAQQRKQAEGVARSIRETSKQVMALKALVTALAQTQWWESAKWVLSQAQEITCSIKETSKQAQVLMALATALTQAHQWKQVEEAVHSIRGASKQAMALTALVTAQVQAHQWKQAEEIARSINDAYWQAMALTALATALAQAHQWEQAEEIARSIRGPYWQAQVLATLTTALAQAHQWEQAEEMARSIRRTLEQAMALTALATALVQAQEEKKARWVLSQAEEVARSIWGASEQAQVLTALAAALAQAQWWERAKWVLSQAEKVARSIRDISKQVQVLTALATALTQDQQWQQAEEVARSIRDIYQQEEALTALATALTQANLWKQAEEVAHSIRGASEQVQVLTTLAMALSQAQEEQRAKWVFLQAEKVARSIRDTSKLQGQVLTVLATTLAQAQQWKQAEEIARSIRNASKQGLALTALATALAQAQQWKQAEEVARSIRIIYQQEEALTTLATALAQAQQWKQAEEVARSIPSTWGTRNPWNPWNLEDLEDLEDLKDLEDSWGLGVGGPSQSVQVLTALAMALIQAQQWKHAEEVARSIPSTYQQAQVLTTLAATLLQAQQWKYAKWVFLQVEEVARSIQDIPEQVQVLTTLATVLLQAQEGEKAEWVFLQAEKVARSIQDAPGQVPALTALARVLTEQRQHSRLLPFVQRSWQLAETRDEALDLFPLVFGLISLTSALGIELYKAFQWVENFLSGS